MRITMDKLLSTNDNEDVSSKFPKCFGKVSRVLGILLSQKLKEIFAELHKHIIDMEKRDEFC